ncbi:MAG: peptide chain release factor 3 [Gemmatimonadales bacterium]|nr:MAG: peptide chain release factor 3 [Gemmatimonadales bacterium]
MARSARSRRATERRCPGSGVWGGGSSILPRFYYTTWFRGSGVHSDDAPSGPSTTRQRVRSGPGNEETVIQSTLAKEVRRRRTFAIISHPDAGKTTLTEKLLLYGGAIHLAGSVKARRAKRHATSDWMEMEQERGISVTSSVLQFDYHGFRINLLDTPGHQDFSEDTYRTLMAADSAVMLLDNRKGVEEQTRKLFEVCRLRSIPIFTFVNKCDRVGVSPLQLLDDVEAELGMACAPLTWPVTDGSNLLGVYDRRDAALHLFQKGGDHGASAPTVELAGLEDPKVRELLGNAATDRLLEEIELLDAVGAEFSEEAFLEGRVSPTFFGSALTNFGVEPFLRRFLAHAPAPPPRDSSEGEIAPDDSRFTAFVFKIQANMDPKHRDRLAFVRICSGQYEPGATVTNVRTGKGVRLTDPQQFFGQERERVDTAWPGDVVGIHDRGGLRIGDTLSAKGTPEFEAIPPFSPEHFARVIVPDPLRRKHLDKGLLELSEEGAVQVFFQGGVSGPAPVVGAVGPLQFDVLLHRLEHEYGVEARLEPMPYRDARWVSGPERDIRRVGNGLDAALVFDRNERPLLLFRSQWVRQATEGREKELEFFRMAPE